MIINSKKVRKILKWKAMILAGLLLLMGGIFSLYQAAYYHKIYPHIFVVNQEVSNLALGDAEELIKTLPNGKMEKITLGFGSQEWEIMSSDVEVTYLPKETAEKAYLVGRSEGLVVDIPVKWNLWTKGLILPYQFKLNEEKLLERVAMVVEQVDEPPIMPELIYKDGGAIEVVMGKNGRVIDRDELIKTMYSRWGNLDENSVNLPVVLESLMVNAEQMEVARVRAEKMKEKELVVKYDDWQKKISGQELIDLVGFGERFDEEKVASLAGRLAVELDRPAQNAVFRFENNRAVEFKPSLKGLKLNREKAIEALVAGLAALEENEANAQEVQVEVGTSEPEITTEEVNSLGIKELLGKGESTFHGSIAGRKHNVALTANRINGVLVPPGEEFSFVKAVGDISAATGYQTAYIIKDGRTVLGDGGGVCQDSTTVFRAALDAGLPITERHPHSYRVTYYEQNSPPGVDATIFSPSVDLKFKNDTPAYILVQTEVNLATNYMKVEIYGTSDGRETTLGNFKLWGQSPPPAPAYQDDPTLAPGALRQVDWAAWGAKTSFDWKVVRNGEVLQEKTFYTSYQPWRAVYLRGI